MKIALLSDFHLGFAAGTKRENESFEQAKKAIALALKKSVDCILIAGDLFDSAVPSQETWHKTFQLLDLIRGEKSKIKIRVIKDGKESEKKCKFLPVIAIHGTHEYRGRESRNAVEVLQSAGFLVYLHAGKAIVEKDNEKITIHGLGGIPEKKALDALHLWNPKPVAGKNILLLHQSIKEFLPFEDEMIATIGLQDLPTGFDLIVAGHMHWNSEQKAHGKRFVVPGSTIITQMKKLESEKKKGVYVFDSKTAELRFFPLPFQRKFFYSVLQFENGKKELIEKAVNEKIDSLLKENSEQPLIRLKLKGTLAKGVNISDIDLVPIEKKFGEKAIISIDCSFSSTAFKEKLRELRKLQRSKQSIASLGLHLLEKNLSETDFGKEMDVGELFDLLERGENEKAIALLLQKNAKEEKKGEEPEKGEKEKTESEKIGKEGEEKKEKKKPEHAKLSDFV